MSKKCGWAMSTHIFINLKANTMNNLKEIYRRTNETEQQILCNIIDTYPNVRIIRSKNVPNVNWCVKKLKDNVILILDAKNPNHTEIGNNKITEFCLIIKKKLYWIDGKQQKTSSNLTDSLYGDMNRAINCKGQFWYVYDGKGYTNKVVDDYHTHLKKLGYDTIKVIDLNLLVNKLKTL